MSAKKLLFSKPGERILPPRVPEPPREVRHRRLLLLEVADEARETDRLARPKRSQVLLVTRSGEGPSTFFGAVHAQATMQPAGGSCALTVEQSTG